MEQPKGFDESSLDRFENLGGKSFVMKMIDLFLENGSQKMHEARTAYDNQDVITTQRSVHALRSSAGNFGAQSVMDLTSQIEQYTYDGKYDDIASLLEELEEKFNLIKINLLEIRQQMEAE